MTRRQKFLQSFLRRHFAGQAIGGVTKCRLFFSGYRYSDNVKRPPINFLLLLVLVVVVVVVVVVVLLVLVVGDVVILLLYLSLLLLFYLSLLLL